MVAIQLNLKKKTGNENFPNVNLVLNICQLIVYLTVPIKIFSTNLHELLQCLI
jgi:hypothetical protein